jgi:hypothetical protein
MDESLPSQAGVVQGACASTGANIYPLGVRATVTEGETAAPSVTAASSRSGRSRRRRSLARRQAAARWPRAAYVLRRYRQRPQEQRRGGTGQRVQRPADCPSIAPGRCEDPRSRAYSDRGSSFFSRSAEKPAGSRPAWKSCVPARVPRVRIPLSPPLFAQCTQRTELANVTSRLIGWPTSKYTPHA